jgi:hypothetical protein
MQQMASQVSMRFALNSISPPTTRLQSGEALTWEQDICGKIQSGQSNTNL